MVCTSKTYVLIHEESNIYTINRSTTEVHLTAAIRQPTKKPNGNHRKTADTTHQQGQDRMTRRLRQAHIDPMVIN